MEAIQKIVEGEVSTSTAQRKRLSRDASMFHVEPLGSIAPKSAADLKGLIHYATREAVRGKAFSLTPRNAGTCMSGGSLTEGWVVDMDKHFTVIGDVDVYHKRVKVQGGVRQHVIEKTLEGHNLYFAPYPSSHDLCGIGGMIGNNASGEKSLRHGATSKNIDRLKVVLSDGYEYEFGPLTRSELAQKIAQPGYEGDLYRGVVSILEDNKYLLAHSYPHVSRNAAGYALNELWNDDHSVFNLARLFIGAQGTLGIVTEAELKLVALPQHRAVVTLTIQDLDDLTPSVQTLLAHNPAACETFDRYTYQLAKKHYPKDAKRVRFAAEAHLVVFALFEGDNAEEVEAAAASALADTTGKGFAAIAIHEQATIDSCLLIRQKSFAMLFDHPQGSKRALAFLEDSSVPLEHYSEFLKRLENILSEYDMTYTYAGHIGVGSIRLIPLVDMAAKDADVNVLELESRLNDLVLEFHGSISADHNDGLIRSPFLERQYGAHMIGVFEQIKNLFDPFHIFNPGKKVYASLQYAFSHIEK